jgi:hypothetical protein
LVAEIADRTLDRLAVVRRNLPELDVRLCERTGLVKHLKIHREKAIDSVVHAHIDGVLERRRAVPFYVTSPALGRRVEQADQHARARSRNDVEFHARIVKRGHRARHQCQIRRAAAQYQCDCHA